MKTETAPPPPKPLVVHPLERLPMFVPRPIPGEALHRSLPGLVCNRTFMRAWATRRAVLPPRSF